MPVATMFAIAAAFWGAHGQPAITAPVPWTWDTVTDVNVAGSQAFARFGTPEAPGKIWLTRSWWDHASNQDRCVVVIHEMGHAAFSLDHTPRGIMAEYDEDRPVPGVCKRSRAGWRAAIRNF